MFDPSSQTLRRAQKFPEWELASPRPSLPATLPSPSANSNRHTYEKLEVRVSAVKCATSLFLIDTKMHFVQGAHPAFRQIGGPT